MVFIEYDHVVQTLSANCPDDSLAVRILPRRMGRSAYLFDVHTIDEPIEIVAVNPVVIADQKTWPFVVRKRLHDLQASPFGVWVGRNIEMNDLSTFVAKNDEDIEDSKRSSRYGKEVTSRRLAHMIFRNVRHVCDGGFFGRIIYLATDLLATSWPSNASSD